MLTKQPYNDALSFAFLSIDTDIKDILQREGVFESFNDLNEAHLCHVMTHVCSESDKFRRNNHNAVKLFNYRQIEEANTTTKYKQARGKRIGNRKLKPYSPKKSKNIESPIGKWNKRGKNKFEKMINNRIIDDTDEMPMNDQDNDENNAEDTDDDDAYAMNLPRDSKDDVIEE